MHLLSHETHCKTRIKKKKQKNERNKSKDVRMKAQHSLCTVLTNEMKANHN